METSSRPARGALQWRRLLASCLMVLAASSASGALLANAQFLSAPCDTTRLIRCQQEVIRDMQLSGGANSASLQQYPIAGPPYSPVKQAASVQALVTPTICRLVRANLDCLLMTTPGCYEQGIQAAQNTDIILRAKRFLEQNNCNEPDISWQSTFCFRGPEVRGCEERFGFTSIGQTQLAQFTSNASACLAYQAFKQCIETHLRLNCKVHEMDMANEYLIDRASDLAWRCPYNATGTGSTGTLGHYYGLSNAPSSVLSPVSTYRLQQLQQQQHQQHYGSAYDHQRPTYMGANRETAWERFRSPLDDSRAPGAGYGSRFGLPGEVSDRLVAGNAFEVDSSDCPVRAAPYARECEDTLIERQRMARDSRDGRELQRRICCSFFQYRDCISRVVLDRCADSSPTAVEILMGARRREMTLTCRSFDRDTCSGSLARSGLFSMPLLVGTLLLAWLLDLKRCPSSRLL